MALTQDNVLPMPGKARLRKASPKLLQPMRSPTYRRRLARQQMSAAAVAAVGAVLTVLSLHHLAHGIELLTGIPTWESVCMAIGIDLAFIALEIAMLAAATDRVRKEIGVYCKVTIAGTLAGSAALNSIAFSAAATGWWVYPAAALGIAVPALIYALSRVAFCLAASR